MVNLDSIDANVRIRRMFILNGLNIMVTAGWRVPKDPFGFAIVKWPKINVTFFQNILKGSEKSELIIWRQENILKPFCFTLYTGWRFKLPEIFLYTPEYVFVKLFEYFLYLSSPYRRIHYFIFHFIHIYIKNYIVWVLVYVSWYLHESFPNLYGDLDIYF